MDYRNTSKRLQAAADLLQKTEVDRGAVDSLRTLLKGIHPDIDKKLFLVSREFAKIDRLQKGEVIALTVDALPEDTPQHKKRKKLLLLLLSHWDDLKKEVTRIEKELAKGANSGNAWANIVAAAKGPLGVVTLVAVGVVAVKMSEVTISIHNINCDPIVPLSQVSINIPGLRLPGTIPPGGEAVAKFPPLRAEVDASGERSIILTALGMSNTFSLDPGTDVSFDGARLNGTRTTLDLGSSKEHTLVITCR